jgi:hypothetical protein
MARIRGRTYRVVRTSLRKNGLEAPPLDALIFKIDEEDDSLLTVKWIFAELPDDKAQ